MPESYRYDRVADVDDVPDGGSVLNRDGNREVLRDIVTGEDHPIGHASPLRTHGHYGVYRDHAGEYLADVRSGEVYCRLDSNAEMIGGPFGFPLLPYVEKGAELLSRHASPPVYLSFDEVGGLITGLRGYASGTYDSTVALAWDGGSVQYNTVTSRIQTYPEETVHYLDATVRVISSRKAGRTMIVRSVAGDTIDVPGDVVGMVRNDLVYLQDNDVVRLVSLTGEVVFETRWACRQTRGHTRACFLPVFRPLFNDEIVVWVDGEGEAILRRNDHGHYVR